MYIFFYRVLFIYFLFFRRRSEIGALRILQTRHVYEGQQMQIQSRFGNRTEIGEKERLRRYAGRQ